LKIFFAKWKALCQGGGVRTWQKKACVTATSGFVP
jgi:hypothetical protein